MEERLYVKELEPVVDLRPSSMDKNRTKTNTRKKDEVTNHRSLKLRNFHGGATIFDDDGFTPESLDVWKGFRQNVHPE